MLATTGAARLEAQGNTLLLSTNQMTFTYQVGSSSLPPEQQLSVLQSGASVTFTATATTTSSGSWLTVSPTTGSTPANLVVSVNPGALGVGQYNGRVEIAAPGTSNSPQSVNVTLHVRATSELAVSPAPQTGFAFAAQAGSINPASQNLTVNTTGSPFTYTLAADQAWIILPFTNGTSSGTPFPISINTAGLTPGTYTGKITITAPGIPNSPIEVPVTLSLTAAPELRANPATLRFVFQVSGTAPPAQTVQITSTGAAAALTITPTVESPTGGTWLGVTASSATTPSTLTVSVNPAGLQPGTYNGTITVTGAGANTITIPVSLTISLNPLANVLPGSVVFNHQLGTTNPAAQSLTISTTGPALTFTATASVEGAINWLVIGATAGTATREGTQVLLGANPSGLGPGAYNGTVTISVPGAANSPIAVPIRLNVSPAVMVTVAPNALTFAAAGGGSAPAIQVVDVTSTDAANQLALTVSKNADWIVLTADSTRTPARLSVTINPTQLTGGVYTGTITVNAAGAVNSPQTVTV
ncbi:MAG: hypothetical protein HYS04_19270, partial [Acidobacteria bacterium]|nr:hypothetical protein [Acidobacteriota bacterium]